ncbi:MAG TPA: TIM-barrel domain-containing protein [Rhizomicrobium sp.]|nr:TIM-barrel domain-containing protein [Rhizomicrobium sp.]
MAGRKAGAASLDQNTVSDAARLIWGTNSGVLRSSWKTPPSLNTLLADRDRSLVLDRFYRAGRDGRPATPTECRIAYSQDALFIAFRCAENDMTFPYANLDPDLWTKANWHSLRGLPSGAASSWPPYPDEVDVLIQPDRSVPSYYQFAATPRGKAFACKRMLFTDVNASADEAADAPDAMHVTQVDGFVTDIASSADDWRVLFQIPWQILGGRPNTSFGILPMRTRWRGGEFSSPVALDLNEAMPVDLLIETHFAQDAPVAGSQSSLCQLPSGMFRWQTPAGPAYPDAETIRKIWRLQSSLTTPTDRGNLAERLYLVQRWMDLLVLEGYTPLRTGWGLLPNDLTLSFVRQRVNAALQKSDPQQAGKILDDYLSQLDTVSRWWYADGSPGNILTEEWASIVKADIEVQDAALVMRCAAGRRQLDLRLCLPVSGGIRICGKNEGYWRPDALLPIKASQSPDACTIDTPQGKIVVTKAPFSVSFHDGAGRQVLQIRGEDLAFRFDARGEIMATDFKNALAPDEIVYGFGEQYDRFNRNGHVLTLWGTDDTIGNGKGLANATYKPLPIFHSSRPYLVFSNSSYRLRADIGKANPSQYRLTQHGPVFDYYVWIGAPAENLASYTALTGRPPLPPKWAFEPWMGRGGGAWAGGRLEDALAWTMGETGAAVAEEQDVTRRFAELDIPHSAIYAEGPSAQSEELHRFMAPRGIRVLGYFRPEIGPARQQALMPQLQRDALAVLRCATQKQTDTLGYVDFTNPNAMELCRRALAKEFALGVAGSMVDFGDWVPDNATFHDGQSGSEMHNFYAYDYQRTVSEVFRERRGNDFILYARAAAPGTQKWLGQFAGDHPSNFEGLRHVLTGALNLCACGYSTWGSDIGGYFGFPQPAVYMRWVQFGCFSPLMRPHGIAPREPWYYGDAAVRNYKFLAWVRENLLNYIYNAAAIASETGLPIMRSMPVAFPDASQLMGVPDQYMFGPDLLVAPVVSEGVARTISFPPGIWTNLWDGGIVAGPVTRKIDAPLDTIPVYLRSGAAVAVQLSPKLLFGDSMTGGRVDALVVTPSDRNEKSSFRNGQGDTATVTAQANGDMRSWILEKLPETSHLLVYGTTAASAVRVNGQSLPKRKPDQPGSGWTVDQAFNRLIIRLPARRGEQSHPTTHVEIDFGPAPKR